MAFSDLDALLTNEIAAEKLKGCSIFVQKGNKTLFQKSYGSDKEDSIYNV